MKDNIISYHGWVGHNNLGDEAIYRACEKLFPNYVLVPENHIEREVSLELFGGGTIWPPKELDFAEVPSAGVGVGVKQPSFYNRKRSTLDFGYYLGKSGLARVTKDTIGKRGRYILPDDFKKLRSVGQIGVRGPLSHKLLQDYNIESQITGDTALILEPSEYELMNNKKIAVTLRDGGKKWGGSNEYIDSVKEICKSRSDQYTFVFIPLKPDDIPLHIALARDIPNAKFKNYCTVPDVSGVIDEYATCELVIAERLHGSILGACSYTPFISIGYRGKNEDFAQSIDMGEFNVRIDRVTTRQLQELFDMASSDDLQSKLKSEVDKKRNTLRNFTRKIISQMSCMESPR
ncbi:polysaccharide pyruvyl transferase family protein [Natronorubrum tibetense]|uniref:polysaccharide pyruvyl transferase family protein n=1 Tax=Natronorubrum tibetense TaxID=63128 RepID=UPI0009DAD91B|nr:polysaccharide pyruvyl transferase family protein [Natronorubrum tibetense]